MLLITIVQWPIRTNTTQPLSKALTMKPPRNIKIELVNVFINAKLRMLLSIHQRLNGGKKDSKVLLKCSTFSQG